MAVPYSANAVAQYLLTKADPDVGEVITNLKLQKLLYYAQGLHLGFYGSPLFLDPVEAWMHGPVVRDIYFKYNIHGAAPFEPDQDFAYEALDEDTREFLDEVYEVYGQFSAWKLRDMTHAEPPWLDTPQGERIPLDLMRAYFSTQVIRE